MGFIRRIKRAFEKTDSIGFKEKFKDAKKAFENIEDRFDNPKDRLEPFKELEKAISKVFDEHDYDVNTAVEKPDPDRDGWRYFIKPTQVAIAVWAFINCTDGTSIPVMASYLPAYFAGIAAVIGGAVAALGVHSLRRHRARELGLSVSDVKHARKLKFHQEKVQRHIKKISVEKETKFHLNNLGNLCDKYNASSGQKPAKVKLGVLSGSGQKKPANTPINSRQ